MSVEAMAVVLHHSQAVGTDKVVLIGIANHHGDGGSWPAIDTLAKYANVTDRSVQSAIGRLVALGEIAVHDQDGGTHKTDPRYRPNRYELLLVCPDACDGTTQHRHISGVKPTAPLTDPGVKPTAARGEVQRDPGVKPTSPEPSSEPSLEPVARFDEFWAAYPRKIGVAAARKSFVAACKKAEPDVIIAALTRRVEWWKRAGTQAQFIPHASTWLNQERWTDAMDPIVAKAASRVVEEQERTAAMRDEVETAIAQGQPETAWQIICERARNRGDVLFGKIASMLDTHTNITIARVLDCDLGRVVTVRELHRRVMNGGGQEMLGAG